MSSAGARFGCSGSYVGKIEKGARLPDRRTANAILREVGIPPTAWDDLEENERAGAEAV